MTAATTEPKCGLWGCGRRATTTATVRAAGFESRNIVICPYHAQMIVSADKGAEAVSAEHPAATPSRQQVVFDRGLLTVVKHEHGELQFYVGLGHDFRSANLGPESVAHLAHALNQWIAEFTNNA